MDNLAKADWTNDARVQRMIKRYPLSYHKIFWDTLQHLVGFESKDVIADFGCGPGLLLTDLVKKLDAKHAYGLDESETMLKQTARFLSEILPTNQFTLQRINFDESQIQLEPISIDFAFSGHMFHEIRDPQNLASQIFTIMKPGGQFALFDYVSGNPEGFVKRMMDSGMTEKRARARYPHMCKHSVNDLTAFLTTAGFSDLTFETLDDESRAIVVGSKK